MLFKEMFGDAHWIGTGNDNDIPIIKDSFVAKVGERAKITVLGFGVFILYINGVRAHREECLPLATDFEANDFPSGELLAHRVYPEVFDISHLLRDGENVIAVLLGNGWYNKPIWEENFGDGNKKVCYRITLTDAEGTREVLSSEKSAVWSRAPITYNHYNKGEIQDLRIPLDTLSVSGEGVMPTVREAELRETDYLFSDCPRDVKIRDLTPSLIIEGDGYAIYDFGINTTGYPIVNAKGKEGDVVEITFSEALAEDGRDIAYENSHDQIFNITLGSEDTTARPYFGWICARYAKVIGDASMIGFEEVHADVSVSCDFECDDECLNYIYRTFLHTQLINMHTGLPSDCPQIERRGYTGDGQLICHSAMMMLDCKSFYRKWLYDISDCQDRISGHVQYTAPYTHAGGGPGGWGSAMVSVPYEFYQRFSDIEPMSEMYPQMHRYLDYLDSHSENGLVVRDRDGEWCLGEWCTPDPVALPAPFVNNYFYVKSCEKMISIARLLGKEEDIPALEERIAARRRATRSAYFNPWDGNCIGGLQGANAFALDMGIGDERTKASFISRYESLGYYDTGIFGTELVTRLLFEYGRADIALRLLTASEPHGFGRFMKMGETTLWEYWGKVARSHCHPMFGAVSAHLFDYVLGIRQNESSTGYTNITIAPLAINEVRAARGYLTTANGERISVSYKNKDGELSLDIRIPSATSATLTVGKHTTSLDTGDNRIVLNI